MAIDNNFLRLDSKENAIDSLSKAASFLQKTDSDAYMWKWFIIAIHHATHSFMLVVLQNTDCSGIWNEPVIRRSDGLVDIFNPNNKLISFMKAYEWIQEEKRMKGYVNARPFSPQPYHTDSMKHLNDRLRNEFIHYRPAGRSVHNVYILDIAKPIFEIINFLVFESGRCYFDENQEGQVRSSLASINSWISSKNT